MNCKYINCSHWTVRRFAEVQLFPRGNNSTSANRVCASPWFYGNEDDVPPSVATTSISSYMSGLNAEILWTLNVIEKHYTFKC